MATEKYTCDCPYCKKEVEITHFTDSAHTMDDDQCPLCGHTGYWDHQYSEDYSNDWWVFFWDELRLHPNV